MSNRLSPEPIARRDFLSMAGLWASGIAVVFSVLGMARLTKPAVLPEAGKRFRVGRPEDFPPGMERTIPGRNVLIVSREEGVAAISMVCTHLGCIVARQEAGFICPCHGSKFDDQGEVLAGPAPRALRWFEVSQGVDGRLVVDAKREVPPQTFFKA